jgi:hypothetical protein
MEDQTKLTCITCTYAVEAHELECRIKPPTPNFKSRMRMFPIMDYRDWCAKHKPKEQNGE